MHTLDEPARMVLRRRMLGLVLPVAIAVIVGGSVALWFTRPTYLDTSVVARAIATKAGGRASCPDHVPLQRGRTFDCTLSWRGRPATTVRVRIVDDKGNVAWSAPG